MPLAPQTISELGALSIPEDVRDKIEDEIDQHQKQELRDENDMKSSGLIKFHAYTKQLCEQKWNFLVSKSTRSKVKNQKHLVTSDWATGTLRVHGEGEDTFEIAEEGFDEYQYFNNLSEKLETDYI